jgi:AraC-like DNA-binding protein
MFLPLLILIYNKGFKTINRFLAGFFFFCSLYLLESFVFFYSDSRTIVAFFTHTHAFFYLIGPFSFFYVRGLLRDNSRLSKTDLLHFVPFLVFFIGFIPYLVKSWSYKLMVADNILSEGWDMAQFHLNVLIPHKVDQGLNVIQVYFYAIALWYLLWKYKRKSTSRIYKVPQFKLIRNWLFIFTFIISVIAINFTVAMANMWLYDDKSVFLQKAGFALLFASIVYVAMNMAVMFFPHIMYGLPIEVKENEEEAKEEGATDHPGIRPAPVETDIETTASASKNLIKEKPLLFSDEYIAVIESALQDCIAQKGFTDVDFTLTSLTADSKLAPHHLTYYFNQTLNNSFTNWRNQLRIEYALELINHNETDNYTLEAIGKRAGFSSYSTFVRAFKLFTGNTPTEYAKLM